MPDRQPLTQDEFNAVVNLAIHSAPPGLSEDEFENYIQQAAHRDEAAKAAAAGGTSVRDFSPARTVGKFLGGLWDTAAAIPTALRHPIDTAGDLIAKQVYTEPRKAYEAFKEGRYLDAAGHAAATAVPVFGPAAADIGERAAETGDINEALGGGAALIATLPSVGGPALARVGRGTQTLGRLARVPARYGGIAEAVHGSPAGAVGAVAAPGVLTTLGKGLEWAGNKYAGAADALPGPSAPSLGALLGDIGESAADLGRSAYENLRIDKYLTPERRAYLNRFREQGGPITQEVPYRVEGTLPPEGPAPAPPPEGPAPRPAGPSAPPPPEPPPAAARPTFDAEAIRRTMPAEFRLPEEAPPAARRPPITQGPTIEWSDPTEAAYEAARTGRSVDDIIAERQAQEESARGGPGVSMFDNPAKSFEQLLGDEPPPRYRGNQDIMERVPETPRTPPAVLEQQTQALIDKLNSGHRFLQTPEAEGWRGNAASAHMRIALEDISPELKAYMRATGRGGYFGDELLPPGPEEAPPPSVTRLMLDEHGKLNYGRRGAAEAAPPAPESPASQPPPGPRTGMGEGATLGEPPATSNLDYVKERLEPAGNHSPDDIADIARMMDGGETFENAVKLNEQMQWFNMQHGLGRYTEPPTSRPATSAPPRRPPPRRSRGKK